ncbi:MAG: glycosyltransferase [Woeseiaceae bacterium]|jgi:glycosyltransferase involved in cell wall biosynthesis|nr:glycosyltransferase [Woeseiaceae bacterium]
MKSRLITPIRLLAALILLVLFTLSILVYRDFTIEQDPEESEDYRMPLTNPPLEPDRPDLIGEPRPFGLSLIESMACGTPVIAFNLGSMPEIIRDGETGYIVEDIEGAINAVATVGTIDRFGCRADVEKRFTSTRMARDYVRVYEKILNRDTRDEQ